ncbi:nuclease [uncultured Mediterranean phage uvMED]|nr:nuclease [uncultured Mediterranean phage uvMED]BAQ91714.1 nuclease [uncultured Mediterranean phage uvMED]BAQ91765.1 nuclease [uncultured Mediterranean phage uvMED]BAQ91812.1 nuclease [uncultured Mediterranean phage uvMED]BAR20462.1 nuclease [uncultured Mediterranean phage uvMED]
MIEHFEKFNDYGKGLLPLSFSHLNEFAFYRERWALRRIFGYQFPTSAPAIRGQVVESGINMFLNGIPIEEASEKMIAEYDANCLEINDPKIDDERANLVPLLELGTKTFQEYAYRWTLLNYQKKVELDIKGIPFIGYTDFHFEDKNTKEDFFIDLKTSKLLPQKISISHAMQQAIYQKATNAKQILWYLKNPTKTKDAEYIAMSLDDYVTPMKICEHIVQVMGNYLKTVNSPDDVKNSLIPNPDNWIWKEETVLNARKEVWGY